MQLHLCVQVIAKEMNINAFASRSSWCCHFTPLGSYSTDHNVLETATRFPSQGRQSHAIFETEVMTQSVTPNVGDPSEPKCPREVLLNELGTCLPSKVYILKAM